MSRHRSALRQRPTTAKWSRRGVAEAAETARDEARRLCDGSCDIALARRQVGPDGLVPGNAKECAEMWEREAARLSAEQREVERELDALREQLRGAEKERDEARAKNEAHAKARTCASCGGYILGPMQCGTCIEREAPVHGMPARPATSTLRARALAAESSLSRLRGQMEALAEGWEAIRDTPRHYTYPEANAADGAEADTYGRCASALRSLVNESAEGQAVHNAAREGVTMGDATTNPAEELHVFFDDCEWWVASSAEDARAQQIAASGIGEDEAIPAEDWIRWADDRLLGMEDEAGTATRKTCAEWAREHGRGLLGGTEY